MTDFGTGRWFFPIARPAWSATVPYFLSLLVFYKSHGFFTEDINLIRPYFKDFCWTGSGTLTASIAFVCVDGDIPFA